MGEIDFQTMVVPFVRQAALFAHLAAFAFAFVLVVQGDLLLLFGRNRLHPQDLHRDAKLVAWLLTGLWVSGLVLVAMGPGLSSDALAQNPKIMAKLTVVTALSLNGVVLHFLIFPMLSRQLSPRQAGVSAFFGAVSSVSWVFATLIGGARLVAHLLVYQDYMLAYAVALAVGVIIAVTWVRPLLLRRFRGQACGSALFGPAE